MARLPVRRREQEREAAPLTRFHEEMDDLISSFFEPFTSPVWGGRWPVLDIAEKDDAFVVKAEVPGCKAEDIDISVRGNTVTISGEKKQEEDFERQGYYRMERSYGTFRRDLNLATEVDPDKIDAVYKEGILTVTIPKTEKSKPRKVQIKAK